MFRGKHMLPLVNTEDYEYALLKLQIKVPVVLKAVRFCVAP